MFRRIPFLSPLEPLGFGQFPQPALRATFFPTFQRFSLSELSFPPSVSHSSSQTFFRELDKNHGTAADRLHSNLDAAVYKHAVPRSGGLRTASSFPSRLANRSSPLPGTCTCDQHLNPADCGTFAKYNEAIAAELEERDYCIEKNVVWVRALARWKTLQDSAKLPAWRQIKESGRLAHPYKITSTGKLIDDTLEAVEKENPSSRTSSTKTTPSSRSIRRTSRGSPRQSPWATPGSSTSLPPSRSSTRGKIPRSSSLGFPTK